MPTPIIHNIALKNMGVFRDSKTPQTLQKYNLIYGFNGSGKTTLSRVFNSLSTGVVHTDLPDNGTFRVELNNDSVLTNISNQDYLIGRLLVFNVDFIEANFRWKEGKANPVFYLGSDQMERADDLKRMLNQKNELNTKYDTAYRDYSYKKNVFYTFKRSTARNIGEKLLLRNYTAPNLVQDYSFYDYDNAHVLPERDIETQYQMIMRPKALPKLDLLSTTLTFNSWSVSNQIQAIINSTIGDISIEDLRDHDSMLDWINSGMTYHEKHNLSKCLFCGSDLTKDRLQALRGVINGQFDKFTHTITEAMEEAKKLRASCTTIEQAIPAFAQIAHYLHSEFEIASKQLKDLLQALSKTAQEGIELLAQKATAPNSQICSFAADIISNAATRDEQIVLQINHINNIITRHNLDHENFESVKKAAKEILKNHYLSIDYQTYLSYQKDEKDAEIELHDLKAKLASLNNEEAQLKKDTRKHGPAVKEINKMIHSYLGRADLEITALDEGYQLCRNSKPIKGPLSEGEKTAIALCYFLATLAADGRKRKNLIVVVDDPISSLDTRALNYSFNILKLTLTDVAQLFILTHNLHFMNETKKWLKRLVKEDEAKSEATLLFLDAVKNGEEKQLSSTIKKLPRHIEEHESEYQYLFHLILRFYQGHEIEYFYLMPNAMRKVLEIFLTFKFPKIKSLNKKLSEFFKHSDSDKASLLAIDRLVQLGSHSDNLDDLVTFSSMTIEEAQNAADVLLKMMETCDGEHYRQMCEICGTDSSVNSMSPPLAQSIP